MSELIEDNRCAKCRWHSEDHLFCENPNSEYYGWFRNDWKKCDKYEELEAQSEI